MSDEELAEIIKGGIAEANASSPADMGRVMKVVMPKLAGRTEGNRVRTVVNAQLSAMQPADNA
jgi:uncharacterized protein YqeY